MQDKIKSKSSSRMIWSLAWPQTLMMFFHFWIGFFDVYVAGKINENTQASLGVITQALFFFLVVAMALANGAVSVVSQSLGAKKFLRAKRYAGLSLVLVVAAGIMLLSLLFCLKGLLLDLLQTPGEIRGIAEYFLNIYLWLLPIYYLLIVSNAVFRARKQVYVPLFSIMLCTILNTLGDFGLSFGLWGLPELGYKGLPWATFISVSLACLFNLSILYKRGWLSKDSVPSLRWIKKGLPYLWQVAWPAGLMQLLWHSAYMVLFSITASLPKGNVIALAALAAGIRLESILFLPAIAFNMTASILVGHYLGEKDFLGAKKIGLRIWSWGVGFISFLGFILWIFIPFFAEIISSNPEVRFEIANYLHFNILAIPFTGTGLILGGVFIGAGATKLNLSAIGGSVWMIRLPLAFFLGHIILKSATGIWSAMLISQFVQASLMLMLFLFSDWTKYSMQAKKNLKNTTGVQYATQVSANLNEKTGRI